MPLLFRYISLVFSKCRCYLGMVFRCYLGINIISSVFSKCHCYLVASDPGLPRYVRILICGGGDNAVKMGKAWAD